MNKHSTIIIVMNGEKMVNANLICLLTEVTVKHLYLSYLAGVLFGAIGSETKLTKI